MPAGITTNVDTINRTWGVHAQAACRTKALIASDFLWLETKDIPALVALGFTEPQAQDLKDGAAEIASWAGSFAPNATLKLTGSDTF